MFAPVDELRADPGFQRTDAAAERGLGDVALGRGARKPAIRDDSEEILKPAQLHRFMSHRYEFIANWHWPAWEVQSYVGEMTQSPAPRTLYDKLLDANTVRRLAGSDQIL